MILTNRMVGKYAMYLRLSRDDGDKVESDSIHSQRELIQQFMNKYKGMTFFKEYVDDGYSGTTFDRPSFIRMMEDLKKKRFDCLIVKDLSRLGRNYIETGRYIERIFPSMGLRLIAINDNYDSLDKASSDNDIVVPFKNLINDAYCRDISMKIRSHLDVKRKDGQFIGNFAMYGYEKDPEDKNHLVIDKYAAEVVQMIFDLRLEGCSALRIAQRLDELGIQPPYEYKRKCGLNFNSGFRSTDKARWRAESVNRILTDEMYTGKMVQGKTKKVNYKVKKSIPVDKNDWIVVDDTHDAIISKEKFEAVQKLGTIDTRVAPDSDEVYPLCGFLKCADCGQSMIRRSSGSGKYKYYYYHCSTYKSGKGCSPHLVNCNKVEKAIIKALQNHIKLLDKVVSLISGAENAAMDRACVKMISKQEERLKKEIEHYGNLKSKLYSDMVDGLISKEEFKELNERFSKSRELVEESLEGVIERKNMILNDQIRFLPWVENLKKHRNITELTRSVVISTIDSVVIHDDKMIEIHFQFEEELNELLEVSMERENA